MTANISDYKGKRAHFIGIGGSSMSGLAGYLQKTGYTVTGSDRTRSPPEPHFCSIRRLFAFALSLIAPLCLVFNAFCV